MTNRCLWCGGEYHAGSLYKKTRMHYACHVTCRSLQDRLGMSRDDVIHFHALTSEKRMASWNIRIITVTAATAGAARSPDQDKDGAGYRWGFDRVRRIGERFVELVLFSKIFSRGE